MSSTGLEALRAAVADEALPLAERKLAAERYAAKVQEAVQTPAPDDADVTAMLEPKKYAEGILGDLHRKAQAYIYTERGWSENGPSPEQARKAIHGSRRHRAVLALIVAESAHRLERLAACQHILDGLDPRHIWKVNAYDAEKVLSKVKPASATKYAGWNKPDMPVARPPQNDADVW